MDRQNYNFHTHTKLCGHAGVFELEEYIEHSRNNGITRIGFSDHCPFPRLLFTEENSRMFYDEIDYYIERVKTIKRDNSDMEVLVSFEAEYDPLLEGYLRDLKSKVDYMVIGQHFVLDASVDGDYPIKYADMVCKGIESGIFDLVAHPEIFLLKRKELNYEEIDKFNSNILKAYQMICLKAKEYNIPIELNLKYAKSIGKEIIPFWEIVSSMNLKVVVGLDVHDPSKLDTMFNLKDEVLSLLDGINLNFVKDDYNPVVSRIQNQRLDIIYKLRKDNVLNTYTYYMVNLLNKIFNRIPKSDNSNEVLFYLNEHLDKEISEITSIGSSKDSELLEKSSSLEGDTSYKTFRLSRIKKNLESNNETIKVLNSLISTLKVYISKAFEIGINDRENIIKAVTLFSEINLSIDDSERRVLLEELASLEESYGKKGDNTSLVKVNPLFKSNENNFNWNLGFTKVFSLLLILSFILGVGVGIALILLKI